MKKIVGILLALGLFFANSADAAPVNKVAAVVNGQIITMFDLQKKAALPIDGPMMGIGNEAKSKQIDTTLRATLDEMILDKLLAAEAKRLKVTVADSEVDARITERYKQQGLTQQQFEKKLAEKGMTIAKLREMFRAGILRQKIMAMEVKRRVSVPESEIRKYFEEHKDTMYNRQGLHMYLIIYHPQAPAAETARKVISGQMSWLEASMRFSVLPSRNKGGDTGLVQWENLNPEWKDRLMRMKSGEITELFNYDKKFKAQVRLARPGQKGVETLRLQSYEEARPMIESMLRAPKEKARFDEYIRQLKSKAMIDIRI